MLMRIAADHGLDLTTADADSYRALMAGAIESYRKLEEFSEPKPPLKYPRDGGWRPKPEDNPCNGWYWRCNIVGATSGVLAGQRVAVKDVACVAGIPMTIGSSLLDGFVPDVDATHRHPHSRCGRVDHRHHQLRGVRILRRRAHLQPRAGAQPA
jgi:amidase